MNKYLILKIIQVKYGLLKCFFIDIFKRFYLSLGRKNEYFRNVELSTGSWLFRRNFIHDLIVREGERTKLWIVNTKTLTNQPDEKIQKVIEKKIFKNSQDTHENKNDLFILLNNKD